MELLKTGWPLLLGVLCIIASIKGLPSPTFIWYDRGPFLKAMDRICYMVLGVCFIAVFFDVIVFR